MKLWNKSDEWMQYASCGGSVDHTLPPDRDDGGPVANTLEVKGICDRCRVRPECIRWALTPQGGSKGFSPSLPASVWVAGRWIPESKQKAKRVREELVFAFLGELESRGEDV